jgi:glycine cleavage system H protein
MKNPNNLHYTKEHLWTKQLADGSWEAGITDYAQDLLGDLVFVDAPKLGTQLLAGAACGLVESVKTGSDLHAPQSGEVIAINEKVLNSPELINDAPYENWIFKYSLSAQSDDLLNADAYAKLVDL